MALFLPGSLTVATTEILWVEVEVECVEVRNEIEMSRLVV
jgi:hypothetical protein